MKEEKEGRKRGKGGKDKKKFAIMVETQRMKKMENYFFFIK